jgi:hypothetical protein
MEKATLWQMVLIVSICVISMVAASILMWSSHNLFGDKCRQIDRQYSVDTVDPMSPDDVFYNWTKINPKCEKVECGSTLPEYGSYCFVCPVN